MYFLLQINELYEEILHETLHSVGIEKNLVNQERLIAFARDAFKVDQETHDAVYQAAVEKEVSTHTCCARLKIRVGNHNFFCRKGPEHYAKHRNHRGERHKTKRRQRL